MGDEGGLGGSVFLILFNFWNFLIFLNQVSAKSEENTKGIHQILKKTLRKPWFEVFKNYDFAKGITKKHRFLIS